MSVATHRSTPAWRQPWQWWLWLQGLVGARYDGLRHFAVVAPGVLMRCGQPRLRDLETIRSEHGLRAIVCARGGTRHPLRGRWFRSERSYCGRHGIELVHMPFSDKATPPADVFDRFVELMRDPSRRPVLVHCEQGFHRTGVLCAAFRIAVQGWPLSKACDEMAQLGYELDNPKRAPLLTALREWANATKPAPAR